MGQLSDVVSSQTNMTLNGYCSMGHRNDVHLCTAKTPDLGCPQVACLSDEQRQRRVMFLGRKQFFNFSLGQTSENGNIFGNLVSEAVDIQLGLPKKKLNRKGLYSWAYHKMETHCKGIGCSIEEMRDRCRAKAREVVAGVEL